jgi:hypothetical protein
MVLHGFDIFSSQTGQTIVTDGGSSECLMDGGEHHGAIVIGQGQF